MHRSVIIQEYSGNIDQRLPDQEALLIQLCEHLFRSGFVFHDSTETEIEAGGSVICDFFDQEADLIREIVSRERFNGFNDYLNNFGWSKGKLQKKICLRILKAFDRLAKGNHHLFNIRYNIAQGLRQTQNHALYDLLLYIETYYSLILARQETKPEGTSEEDDFSTKNYKLGDLMQLRSQLQERLEGRELVKGFLKHIAKERGVSPESLVPQEKKQDRKYPTIVFPRPSKQTLSGGKVSEAIMTDINQTLVNKIEDDEPGINSTVVDDQEEQMEIFLEPDLEQFTDAVSAEIAEGNNAEEVTDENINELNSSETRTAEYEEKTEGSEDEGNEDISASTNFDDKSESQVPQLSLSSAHLLSDLDEAADEEFIEDDEDGLLQDDAEDDDVVFGSKRITQSSLEKFVRQYSDSTLKFLLRRTLDGRPLPGEIEEVYVGWEKRGLSRGRLKKYVLKLMEWSEIPDMPILDLLQIIRDRVYEVSQKN